MYSEAYHLHGDPFRLSPDQRYCFRHQSYARNKAYLDYALERGEGFVMITGSPGSGKTTLLNDVLSKADKSKRTIARIVTSQLDANDLLRMVAYSFNITTHDMDKASLLHKLEIFLADKYRQHQHSLLIIDEAQALNKPALEEIRLLTNLQIDSNPLLQVFLVGQNNLLDLIQDPDMEQLHQRLIASSHLESMKAEETEIYVIHRLRMAGWNHDPLISRGALRRIHLFSQGIPRIVNQLCSRLLLYGSVEDLHRLDSNDVQNVINELYQEHLTPLTYNYKQDLLGFNRSSDDDILCEAYDLEFPDTTILNDVDVYETTPVDKNPDSRVTDITDYLSDTSGRISPDNKAEEHKNIPQRQEHPVINFVPQTDKPAQTTAHHIPTTDHQEELSGSQDEKTDSDLSLQKSQTDTSSKQPGKMFPAVVSILATVLLLGGILYLFPQPAANQADNQNSQPGLIKRMQDIFYSVIQTKKVSTTNVTHSLGQNLEHNLEHSLKNNALDYKQPKQGFYSIELNIDDQFGWGSAIMTQQLQSKITQVAQVMRDQPNTIIHIIGFCDPSGSKGWNLQLSQTRAKVVANYLALKGIPAYRLTTEGRGSDEVISADNPKINRRVELLIESITPVPDNSSTKTEKI